MARKTVLYVEDEDFDVLFMRRAFKHAGLEECLQVVMDGQDAIRYLNDSESSGDNGNYPMPSLILLDLNMPMISGFQVLEWLKQRPVLKDIPVVVFSSSPRPEDKTRAKELGAAEYVEKPGSGMAFGGVVEAIKQRWL